MITDLLEFMRRERAPILERVRELAAIESPTGDRMAVNRAVEAVADWASGLGEVRRFPQTDFGDHLRIEVDLGPGSQDGLVLGMGHLDTVYPLGTLETMPIREAEGRLWGPGVFDMKAGVVYFLWAARALRELKVPVRRRFVLQLNSDEEVGSPSSRPLTEEIAKQSAAVLVAEPSYGLDGRVKTARKGGGTFTVRVRGRASHAGLDFEAGASANLELARQIDRIAGWTDLKSGLTISPGLMRGGSATNVVAAEAEAVFDVRVPRADQVRELEARFHALEPFDDRTTVRVEGGLRRPPMERGEGTARLFELAREISSEMGVELGEAAVGGGSDGNLTAAVGAPTLDGLGAVGEGAHAVGESILLDRVADRAALLAALIARC